MLHRVKEYTPIELDIKKDPVFLDVVNEIDKETLKKYEEKIENNIKIDPVNVIKVKNKENILEELDVSELISLTREARKDEWIYIITDGCHRATAHRNKKKNIPAYLIWIDE